jgi:hypothetical protein
MKTEKMVKVVYRGTVYEIPESQYEDLRSGWIRWEDLFD